MLQHIFGGPSLQMSGEGKKDRGDNVIEANGKDSSFFPQATQAEPERIHHGRCQEAVKFVTSAA